MTALEYKAIPVNSLQPDQPVLYPLFDRSGVELFSRGGTITADETKILAKWKISVLFPALSRSDFDSRYEFKFGEALGLSDLTVGDVLDKPVFNSEGALLLDKGHRITDKIIEGLKNRGITRFFTLSYNTGSQKENAVSCLAELRERRRLETGQPHASAMLSLGDERYIVDKRMLTESFLNANVSPAKVKVPPEEPFLRDEIETCDPLKPRGEEAKRASVEVRESLGRDVSGFFKKMGSEGKGSAKFPAKIARTIVSSVIEDPQLTKNLLQIRADLPEIYEHCLNVACLSASLGTALGFSGPQVYELTFGAFLNDIGMTRISPAIIEKRGALSLVEETEIKKHPAIGLKMVESFAGRMTKSAPYIIYQSHERPDGTGYPMGRKDAFIHTFAKIVAIADTYCGMTSRRPYHPSQPHHKAIEVILRLGAKSKLDRIIIKKLVETMSAFPVGSLVELSNGLIAKVVAPSVRYTAPFVSILMNKKGERFEKFLPVNLSARDDIYIIRGLDSDYLDVGPLYGF